MSRDVLAFLVRVVTIGNRPVVSITVTFPLNPIASSFFIQALEVHLTTPDGLLFENAETWLRDWSSGRVTMEISSPSSQKSLSSPGPEEGWEVLCKEGDSSSN